MQRYGVFKFNASIIQIICVKNVLYNIFLFFSHVFELKTSVFLWLLTYFSPSFKHSPISFD